MVAKPYVKRKPPRSEIPTVPGSALSPAEMEERAIAVFGKVGWQKTFARGTGLAPSTVTRYMQGIFPIPEYVALIIEMLATLKRHDIPLPDRFSVDASERPLAAAPAKLTGGSMHA